MARPTNFEVLADLSVAMWEPVFRQLTEEDLQRLSDLDYDEALYRSEDDDFSAKLTEFSIRRGAEPTGDSCEWMSEEQIVLIHDRLIDAFGGEHGVRVHDALRAYLDRAMNSRVCGHDSYPTVFEKAAYIFRSICAEHPFVDGQKRTGLAVAFILLGLNGYALWSRHQGDEVHYAIHVAQGKKEVDEIAGWLRERVGPLVIGRGNPNIISMLGGPKGPSAQPRCRTCGRYLTLAGRYALCLEKCKVAYELTARAVALAQGWRGQNIEVKVGLHKVGEEVEPFNHGEGANSVVFRVTARDHHEGFVSRWKATSPDREFPKRGNLRLAIRLPDKERKRASGRKRTPR